MRERRGPQPRARRFEAGAPVDIGPIIALAPYTLGNFIYVLLVVAVVLFLVRLISGRATV